MLYPPRLFDSRFQRSRLSHQDSSKTVGKFWEFIKVQVITEIKKTDEEFKNKKKKILGLKLKKETLSEKHVHIEKQKVNQEY